MAEKLTPKQLAQLGRMSKLHREEHLEWDKIREIMYKLDDETFEKYKQIVLKAEERRKEMI